MRPALRTLVLSAAAAAALVLSARSADAQLGGVLRRAAGSAAGQAATPAAAPAAGRAPTFDENTLEVTAEVLDRFLAGLAAEGAERQKLAGERARAGDLRVQVERFERCQGREREARDDRGAELSASSDQVAMRLAQALMRNDTATYRRLTDSMMVAVQGGPSTCGERPTAAYQALRRLDAAGEHLAGVSADAGRFTTRQFAVLRERIAPWVLSQGRDGALSAAERAALERRREELARHGELLRA